jgi:hypothetical protein
MIAALSHLQKNNIKNITFFQTNISLCVICLLEVRVEFQPSVD